MHYNSLLVGEAKHLKRGRKPTVAECNHIKSFRLNSSNWLLSKKQTEEWLIVHRETGSSRVIPAP